MSNLSKRLKREQFDALHDRITELEAQLAEAQANAGEPVRRECTSPDGDQAAVEQQRAVSQSGFLYWDHRALLAPEQRNG